LGILALEINSEFLTSLDASVSNWFDEHRQHRGHGDSLGIFVFIGNPIHVAVAGLVSGSLLALQARSALRLIVVTGTVGLGAVIEQTLKAMTDRTHETLAALDAYTHTFPSGHVTGAAALFGMIAVCLGTGRGPTVRATLTFAATFGVLAVAVLALYVRAHVFTDVIGGMANGGALVALGAAMIVSPTGGAPAAPDKRQFTHGQTRTV
jgi:undecaprenyl-diphosphatase